MTVRDVMQAHPHPSDLDRELVLRCITECSECALSCTSCADACLAEPDVKDMLRCIRLCLDCGDLCNAMGRALTRQTEADLCVLRVALEACATACRTCGEECQRHASHHEHCRLCADNCRRCDETCKALVAAMG